MTRRKRMLKDLEDDIRDYLERETQDNIDRGMSAEEARYAALRKFGNVTRVKEETWKVWSIEWLERLLQDLRFAIRGLIKSPWYTASVVLTLALGLGSVASMLAIVDSVLLRPIAIRIPISSSCCTSISISQKCMVVSPGSRLKTFDGTVEPSLRSRDTQLWSSQ